jgi:predicted peptidase
MIALLLLAQATTGFVDKTIEYNGAQRKYVLYVPPKYDEKTPAPAILFLHGAGETGDDGQKQASVGLGPAIRQAPDKWPFIVMFPQKPPPRGNWMKDEKHILDILEATKKDYKVDANRLYCTGLSMGGYGTWMLAAKHPKLFAAIAPVCGGGNPADAEKLKDIPIWNFHGDKDTAVPIKRSQEMIDAIKAAGGKPEFKIYEGVGHNCWDKAYREEGLNDWFLKNVKKE